MVTAARNPMRETGINPRIEMESNGLWERMARKIPKLGRMSSLLP